MPKDAIRDEMLRRHVDGSNAMISRVHGLNPAFDSKFAEIMRTKRTL
jgi:hypothetical protein